jgi:hypothetical protein
VPPVEVVASPATTSGGETTDTTCKPRTTCLGCFERTECGVCLLRSGALACRGETDALLVNGETGPHFCEREGGTWYASNEHDVCVGSTAADGVNNGSVTEADVSKDLEDDAPLTGCNLIVTVITQASRKEDGSSHFQTFVDADCLVKPTGDQLHSICESIAKSLSTRLGVEKVKINCELTETVSNKRLVSSYVADLTVNQQSSSASVALASVALLAASLALTF